jgi:glyoxylase-like metal-dependent hydrolase (beta-lactamase superfamily II)
LALGSVKIRVIHTPGHTLESSCFVLTDSKNSDVVLFSGDTVFLGEVGRPDLACS